MSKTLFTNDPKFNEVIEDLIVNFLNSGIDTCDWSYAASFASSEIDHHKREDLVSLVDISKLKGSGKKFSKAFMQVATPKADNNES